MKTLAVTESERYLLLFALANSQIRMFKVDSDCQPADANSLMVRIVQAGIGEAVQYVTENKTPPSIRPENGKAAAAAILSPPATANLPVPADHWVKKKPDSWETIEVPISKVEEKTGANGAYLRVTWPNQGRGFAYGSVFDEALFPFIKAREKQKTVLYTVTAGKYINIIGVRA